jgi:ABC transporter substrate binding protein
MITAPCARDLADTLLEFFIFHVDHTDIVPLRLNSLALSARLPTIHSAREQVEAGGLISYGTNLTDLFRRCGDLVDKILREAKPADIPGRAADQVRPRRQSLDRQGARPRRVAHAACPRRTLCLNSTGTL